MNNEKKSGNVYRLQVERWYISRAVYLIGGFFIFISVFLALAYDERWLYMTLFVGFMLVNFALTGYCPMAIFLDKMGVPKE